MVLDRQQDNSAPTNEIQHQVIIQDKFSKVVTMFEKSLELFDQMFGIGRANGPRQEGMARLWKLADCRNNIVEKPV